MVNVYSGNELEQEKGIKKRMHVIWFILLSFYAALTVGLFVWYLTLEYLSPVVIWIEIAEIVLTVLFCCYTFVFYNIPYRRQKKYVILLQHLDTGLKEFSEGKFVRFSDKIEVRDGVDFYHMVTSQWNEQKQEFMERKVLLDKEKPFPDVHEGDTVMYKTQGNVLIEYMVRKKDETA